jgi:hypothetical protein
MDQALTIGVRYHVGHVLITVAGEIDLATVPQLRGQLTLLAAGGRNRAVWYCAATLPLPVRHGDAAGAAQDDIGQSFASTCRKSFSLTSGSFHGGVSFARPYATTRETPSVLLGIWRPGCFTGSRL